MARILTNNIQATLATDQLTVFAFWFNTTDHFHISSLFKLNNNKDTGLGLLLAVGNSTFGGIVF